MANNEKLKEIIDYLNDGTNYDKQNFINDLSMECMNTNGISPDELSINWGGKLVGDLDSYNKEFYDTIIESVVNVISSFEEK